ncbi:branched-chain amino acid ABC transporter substrate-binding protein, partial [Burkholderia pseudomallei]
MNIKLQKLLPISAAAMLLGAGATYGAAEVVVMIGDVGPLSGGVG